MKTKIFVIVILIIGLFAFNAFFPFRDYLQAAMDWSQRQGSWAAILYFLLFVACVVFFIPVAPLIMLAGTLYGFWLGYALVASSGVAAVVVTYALGKKLWRKKVEQLRADNPRFESIFEAISRHGNFLVFLIRLNPLLPYSLLNYLFTIPKLEFRKYVLSSFLGMSPDILFYLYIGRLGRGWLDANSKLSVWNWVILGTAVITTTTAVLIIRHLVTKAVHAANETAGPPAVISSH